MLKKVLIVVVILLAIGSLYMAFQYQQANEKHLFKGTHQMLLLLADPSEPRPGMGAVDMAFDVKIVDGNVEEIVPIYPGGMAHPTQSAPAEVQKQGVSQLLLHDSLWDKNPEVGAKFAQEIVEANLGYKTDSVVIVTPDAVDAMVRSVGSVQTSQYGTVSGNTIDFLRDEQKYGTSRGNAVESVMRPLLNAAKDPSKSQAFYQAVADEYLKGNIVVVPRDLAIQFALSKGINIL